MSEGSLTVRWQARKVPLPLQGLAARGAVAHALARRLLARDGEALQRLRGVAGKGVLEPPALVPVGAARELARERLQEWLAAEGQS